VDEINYSVAAAINDVAGAGTTAMAPIGVSQWIAAQHNHAYPLFFKFRTLVRQTHLIGEEDVLLRHRTSVYVTRELPDRVTADRRWRIARRFESALAEYNVSAVCFSSELGHAADIKGVLVNAGFVQSREVAGYQIWARPVSSSHE